VKIDQMSLSQMFFGPQDLELLLKVKFQAEDL
jgi:hypothetical protein